MTVTPGRDLPILGQDGRPTSNPLVVLNNHLGQITEVLQQIAGGTPHVYTQTIVQDPQQGRVWGTFCLGCSEAAREYVYPCKVGPVEPLIPPRFFTVDAVFDPDEHGRLRRVNTPS